MTMYIHNNGKGWAVFKKNNTGKNAHRDFAWDGRNWSLSVARYFDDKAEAIRFMEILEADEAEAIWLARLADDKKARRLAQLKKGKEMEQLINITVLVIGNGTHLVVFNDQPELTVFGRRGTVKLDEFKPISRLNGMDVRYSIFAVEAPKAVLFGLVERFLAIGATFEVFDLEKSEFNHPNMPPDMIPILTYRPDANPPVMQREIRPILQEATDS